MADDTLSIDVSHLSGNAPKLLAAAALCISLAFCRNHRKSSNATSGRDDNFHHQ
jgi:hypothetical protein